MKTFKDNEGREWKVSVNVTTVKRARDLAGVDFLDVTDGKIFDRLADPIDLCNALYAVCKDQADAQGVTDENFGKALGGEAIDAAADALTSEILSFFPKGRRELLTNVNTKLKAAQSKALTLAMAKVDGLDLDKLIAEASGDSSGNVPASSASIPAP